MVQQRPPVWALVAVAIVVLVGVSSLANSAGWSDGYQMGLLASGAAGGKIAPQMLPHAGWGYHHGGFGFFGGIFRFFFFLFFLGLIAKFLGLGRWRRHGGPGHHHWPHQGPWGQEQSQESVRAQGNPAQSPVTAPTATNPADSNRPQPVVWV